MATNLADPWSAARVDAYGEPLPPGLRNRRRYALWQASRLSERLTADPVDSWHTAVNTDALTAAGQRRCARDLVREFQVVLGQAQRQPGAVWVFKGIHGVVGVHVAMWSLLAAPANPQRVHVCFDKVPGVAVEYGGVRETPVERVLLADAVEQLAVTVADGLCVADLNLSVYPPHARTRARWLAAEVTGQPYPYELPEHARSARWRTA